ncbi:MAG: 30S ribosomal protein S15 [Candidatus Nomurabacteria bacterium]|jgi:small subunit ribosomal protein S15|nr:30S ribosomal protein S15 [Candidatus Nomurabacteria bacterium]
MISKSDKAAAIARTRTSQNDVGSPQAQVAILTARIQQITEHLKEHPHDNMSRRGLLQMVGKRKRLLRGLEKNDFAAYKSVITTLGLRK